MSTHREPSKEVQRLATQIYLSGKCKNLEDAYFRAEAQLNPNNPFEELFGKGFYPWKN